MISGEIEGRKNTILHKEWYKGSAYHQYTYIGLQIQTLKTLQANINYAKLATNK